MCWSSPFLLPVLVPFSAQPVDENRNATQVSGIFVVPWRGGGGWKGREGGGTPLHGLFRYVRFFRVSILAILVINTVRLLPPSLYIGMFLKRS